LIYLEINTDTLEVKHTKTNPTGKSTDIMQIGDVIRGPFNSLVLRTHRSNSVQNEVIIVDYMDNQIRPLSFLDELK